MGVFPSSHLVTLVFYLPVIVIKEVFNKAIIQTVYWYDDTSIADLGGKRGLYTIIDLHSSEEVN